MRSFLTIMKRVLVAQYHSFLQTRLRSERPDWEETPPEDPTLTAGTQPVRRRKDGVRTASQVVWTAPKFQAPIGVL